MPSGEHLKNGGNKQTRFSSDRQPENRKKPDSITALIKQELQGDGWAVLQDAEILGEDGKPTGQKATVRVKLTTADAVAKKILQRAMKSSDKLMTELWERIDGKVPQNVNLGIQDPDKLLPRVEISFRPPTDDVPSESDQKGERQKG